MNPQFSPLSQSMSLISSTPSHSCPSNLDQPDETVGMAVMGWTAKMVGMGLMGQWGRKAPRALPASKAQKATLENAALKASEAKSDRHQTTNGKARHSGFVNPTVSGVVLLICAVLLAVMPVLSFPVGRAAAGLNGTQTHCPRLMSVCQPSLSSSKAASGCEPATTRWSFGLGTSTSTAAVLPASTSLIKL